MAKEAIILILLSIVIAFSVNAFSPKGIPLVGQWDIEKGVVTAKAKSDIAFGVSEITDVQTAKAIFDSGIAVFVDARHADVYNEGHILGAFSLPIGQVDEAIHAFVEQYPKESMIITYCSGRTCEDSHILSQRFLEQGYTDVSVFIDGFPGWEMEGYPIEAAEKHS